MQRGDIVYADLPWPQGRPGHEQAGTRPAVVVMNAASAGKLPLVTVVPFTGKMGALQFPHTIKVDPSPGNGLTQSSVLLVFQLRALDKRRIAKVAGRLEDHHLRQLEAEMRDLLGL